jgi:hypothetical protein
MSARDCILLAKTNKIALERERERDLPMLQWKFGRLAKWLTPPPIK